MKHDAVITENLAGTSQEQSRAIMELSKASHVAALLAIALAPMVRWSKGADGEYTAAAIEIGKQVIPSLPASATKRALQYMQGSGYLKYRKHGGRLTIRPTRLALKFWPIGGVR